MDEEKEWMEASEDVKREDKNKYLIGFLHEPGFSFTIEAKDTKEAKEKVMSKTKVRRKEILVSRQWETDGKPAIRQYPTIDEWLAEKKRLEELANGHQVSL